MEAHQHKGLQNKYFKLEKNKQKHRKSSLFNKSTHYNVIVQKGTHETTDV